MPWGFTCALNGPNMRHLYEISWLTWLQSGREVLHLALSVSLDFWGFQRVVLLGCWIVNHSDVCSMIFQIPCKDVCTRELVDMHSIWETVCWCDHHLAITDGVQITVLYLYCLSYNTSNNSRIFGNSYQLNLPHLIFIFIFIFIPTSSTWYNFWVPITRNGQYINVYHLILNQIDISDSQIHQYHMF